MKRFLFLFIAALSFLGVSAQENQIVSVGNLFDGEPYIAVNPENSQHFVVAWMSVELLQEVVIRSRVSFDAGESWSDPIYQPHVAEGHRSADESIQFDHLGNVFMAFIDFNDDDGSSGAIYVVKSEDGGLTWLDPVEAISVDDCPDKLCIDRPWMVIDRSEGPNQGNIYVTSMNASLIPVEPPYNPYLAVSTDGGLTFEDPMLFDNDGFLAGNLIDKPMPAPAIGADGTLHAIYPSYELSQSIFAQLIMGSTDNSGEEITYQIAAQGNGGVESSLLKKGPLLLTDPTDANHLCYFFTSADWDDSDIAMIETFDKGAIWTDPLRLNDDPIGTNKLQDLVWADFDQDGDLVVCWRDRRDADEIGFEVPSGIYGTVLWKDSTDFEPNFTVASELAEHNEILTGAGNDFMSVAFVNDTLNAVWGDVRSGTLKIYLNRMSLADGTSSIYEISGTNDEKLIYPNPCEDYLFIDKKINPDDLKIFDSKGILIMESTNSNENSIFVGNLKPGIYYLNWNDGIKPYTKPFIKL